MLEVLDWKAGSTVSADKATPPMRPQSDGGATSAGDPGRTGGPWVMEFDGMPSRADARINKYRKNAAYQQWVKRTIAAVKQEGIPALERVVIDAVFMRASVGLSDPDNETGRLKPLLDGLVQAGVIPNDTKRYVTLRKIKEQRGTPGVAIRVSAASPICSWCNDANEPTSHVTYGWDLCGDCWVGMVGAFFRQRLYSTVFDFLNAAWKKRHSKVSPISRGKGRRASKTMPTRDYLREWKHEAKMKCPQCGAGLMGCGEPELYCPPCNAWWEMEG